jgi:flagellar protein FliS
MVEGDLYLKANVEGMNNDELILFIYQEMLKVLNQTLYYFEKNDIEKRVTAINKGIEVLNALISILNFDDGGEIAVRLRSLYLYSIKKLTSANFDKDPKPVAEVVTIFKNLHTGWAEKLEADKKAGTGDASHTPRPETAPSSPSMPPQPGFNDDNGEERKGLEIYG